MWDLFCSVVDNYGDIGVAWRLARTLEAEQAVHVRLWVDDLVSFACIEPRVDPLAEAQTVANVEIRAWREPFPDAAPGAAVIEAFGCTLPESFLRAMAERRPAPVWINLEYLTAEDWAASHHGLPSPHPRLPLVKHFFLPGFDPRTGGLLRERDALAPVDAPVPPAPLRVSVFSYENAAFPALLSAWAVGTEPVECIVPEGRALDGARRYFGGAAMMPGSSHRRGMLTVVVHPWTDQPGYDRLLRSCDWNFVRGEDSFVRAQWAARPLVWHIYPQADRAHAAKLEAFLTRYREGLSPEVGGAFASLTRWWNGLEAGSPEAWWRTLRGHGGELQTHARRWADRLAAGPELATALAKFIRERLK
jgi:uncharacterized repeat protein (TIGR03837 family)